MGTFWVHLETLRNKQNDRIFNLSKDVDLAFWHYCLSRCTRITQEKNDCIYLVFRKMSDTTHFIANILGPILYMMREMTFERKLYG